MTKLERLAHDALNFLLAGLLVVLGLSATGDWGKDWAAVAVSVLAIALKALNPKDDSYGLVGKQDLQRALCESHRLAQDLQSGESERPPGASTSPRAVLLSHLPVKRACDRRPGPPVAQQQGHSRVKPDLRLGRYRTGPLPPHLPEKGESWSPRPPWTVWAGAGVRRARPAPPDPPKG